LPSNINPTIYTLAQELAQQMVANIFRTDGANIIHNPTSCLEDLKQGVPLWIASLKARHHSPRTIQGYEADVKNYLKRDQHPTFLSIQGYIAERLDKVSSARVLGERKALTSFFKFLYKNELILGDPTAKLESIKVTHKERELPTRQDIEKLLKSECFHRNNTAKFRTMTLLLANTGLRLGEACTIKKADIRYNSLEIIVMGKGRKQRVVPISEYVAQKLKDWINQDGRSEWLFPSDNLHGFWDERSYEKTFRRQCRRYGIRPFTPHALRHYFATQSLKNGARLEVVSRLLGHASIAITADIYTHIDKEEIHETHSKFAPFSCGR
jgi:site-specific recombinase XerD